LQKVFTLKKRKELIRRRGKPAAAEGLMKRGREKKRVVAEGRRKKRLYEGGRVTGRMKKGERKKKTRAVFTY